MRKTRSKSRRVRRVTRKRGGNGKTLWNTAKKVAGECVGILCNPRMPRPSHVPNTNNSNNEVVKRLAAAAAAMREKRKAAAVRNAQGHS